MREKEIIPVKKKITLGRNPSGFEVQREKKVSRRENKCLCRREKERNETDFVLKLFKENESQWIEDLLRFY